MCGAVSAGRLLNVVPETVTVTMTGTSPAPASEAGPADPVPKTVDAASRYLGSSGSHLDPATEHYVRHGLYLAVHHVFLGLILVSTLTVAVLIFAPRHFEKLRF